MLSVADLHQLPEDIGAEVAFVGRSNAGKSSVLNRLTQNKQMARVSKTPGRTQLINLFSVGEEQRLADLPGYGYAKVPLAMREKWQVLLDAYLRERESLQGLVLVMDIRHPMREFDQHIIGWALQCDLPVHIILNKSDKLSHQEARKTLDTVSRAFVNEAEKVTVQTFSALKNLGTDSLRGRVEAWLLEPNKKTVLSESGRAHF